MIKTAENTEDGDMRPDDIFDDRRRRSHRAHIEALRIDRAEETMLVINFAPRFQVIRKTSGKKTQYLGRFDGFGKTKHCGGSFQGIGRSME